MTGYYLPHDDPGWEDAAERAAAAIRAEIAEFLRQPKPRLFVDWLECDGLDVVGSPLHVPAELTEEQRAAHDAAVEALIGFLEHLDIDPDVIEQRVDDERDNQAAIAADEQRARRKEQW